MVRLLSIALLFGLVSASFGKRLPRNPPQPMECGLKPNPGPCLVYMPRYYFHSDKMSCEGFIYGGCGGNDNRFWSKKECEDRCRPDYHFKWPYIVGSLIAVCIFAIVVTAIVVVYKKLPKKRVQDASLLSTEKLGVHSTVADPCRILYAEKPAPAQENIVDANPLPPPAYEEKVVLS